MYSVIKTPVIHSLYHPYSSLLFLLHQCLVLLISCLFAGLSTIYLIMHRWSHFSFLFSKPLILRLVMKETFIHAAKAKHYKDFWLICLSRQRSSPLHPLSSYFVPLFLFFLQSFSLSSVWLFLTPPLTPYSANELYCFCLHFLPSSSSLPPIIISNLPVSVFYRSPSPSPSCSVYPASSLLFIWPSFRTVSLPPPGIWSYRTAPRAWI